MASKNIPDTQAARRQDFISCCLIFAIFSLLAFTLGSSMIADGDPYWHVATGQWILSHHALPVSDPWSFTAGDYRWLNISWVWDCMAGVMQTHYGWTGLIAANALTLGLAASLIYAVCLTRTDDWFSASLATIFALTLVHPHLRPMQATHVFLPLWLLILANVARGRWDSRWLALLPVSLMLWVNMHGGFLAGGITLAAYSLHALRTGNRTLLWQLCACGAVCLPALLVNPYGFGIIEAVFRPLADSIAPILGEWQPIQTSLANLISYAYAVAFTVMVLNRLLPTIFPAERWLAYLWLLLAMTSVRHFAIFAIVSAPVFACTVKEILNRRARLNRPTPWAVHTKTLIAQAFGHPAAPFAAIILCMCLALWLPSPAAARLMNPDMTGLTTLTEEIAFIETHYPKARLLTDFTLSGDLIFEARGRIPPFVDGRTQTAYPAQVVKDYMDFFQETPGWDDMFERYKIDGMMLPNDNKKWIYRFSNDDHFKKIHTGPTATIFLREKP